MVEYICNKCKYSTNIKTHYTRHCTTKKHKRNIENELKIPQNTSTYPQNTSSEQRNTIYKCKHCDKEFTRIDNMNRHSNQCKIKNNEIENLKKKIIKLETEKNQESTERLKLEKEKKDIQIEYNDFLKTLAKRPTFSNTYNVSKASYILSTFPNAYTLKYMLDTRKVSNEEILLCLEKGIIKGPALYIYKKCAAELDDHLKPIWCTDLSRNSFMINEDEGWIRDFSGKEIFGRIYDIMKKELIKAVQSMQSGKKMLDLAYITLKLNNDLHKKRILTEFATMVLIHMKDPNGNLIEESSDSSLEESSDSSSSESSEDIPLIEIA
jgi:hypothetical protein